MDINSSMKKCLINTGIHRFSLFFPHMMKKNVTEIDYRNKNRKKMWYINDKLGYVFYS